MKNRVSIRPSTIHFILWLFLLLASIIEKYTFRAPEMEPLDFALSKAMYNVFIIVAAAGVMNAAILLLSFHPRNEKRNAARRLAVTATILFYSSAVLIFLINTDAVVIVPIAWLFCELCCGILLVLPLNARR